MKIKKLCLLLILLVITTGCVQRRMIIESQPPGARVFVDRVSRGYTPLTLPFSHYGVRRITVEKEDYVEATQIVEIEAPWYQSFWISFFVDVVWPQTIYDIRYFNFELEPVAGEDQEILTRAKKAKEEFKKEFENDVLP